MTRFLDLRPEDLAGFVRHHRAFPGTWLFHHIPKTAGSSLVAELAASAAPYRNIHVAEAEAAGDSVAAMSRAADRFLAERALTRIRSASGHLSAEDLAAVRAAGGDEVRAFTFLRDPVGRVVSEYRYCRSPSHPPHEEFARRYPSLDDFAEDPGQANAMAAYLLGRTRVHGRDRIGAAEAVAAMATRYHVLGLQDRYAESFALLSSCLWSPAAPRHRERVGGASPEPVDVATRARILAANDLDAALHGAVLDAYDRLAGAIAGLAAGSGPGSR